MNSIPCPTVRSRAFQQAPIVGKGSRWKLRFRFPKGKTVGSNYVWLACTQQSPSFKPLRRTMACTREVMSSISVRAVVLMLNDATAAVPCALNIRAQSPRRQRYIRSGLRVQRTRARMGACRQRLRRRGGGRTGGTVRGDVNTRIDSNVADSPSMGAVGCREARLPLVRRRR